MTDEYQRILTSFFVPFDPLVLAKETEKIVSRSDSRKYTDFYCTGVYGGISTGYLVGCCLRCIFCWVDFSRDYPETYGEFYTPEQVVEKLVANAKKSGVKKVRISGGEPTLSKEHLLKVLDLVERVGLFFILSYRNFNKFRQPFVPKGWTQIGKIADTTQPSDVTSEGCPKEDSTRASASAYLGNKRYTFGF